MAVSTFDRPVEAIHFTHEVPPSSPLYAIVDRARGALDDDPSVIYTVEGGHVVQGSGQAVYLGDDGEVSLTDVFEAFDPAKDVEYVQPTEYDRNAVATGFGPRFRTADANRVMLWRTKAQAVKGARAIGWPVDSPDPIHTRLGGKSWALRDGRFGYLARTSYEALRAARNESSLDEEISKSQLARLEAAIDKLFASAGIDVEFTKHFHDRVNDARNIQDITVEELAKIFRQVWEKYRKTLEKASPNWRAIIQDLGTDIHIPVVIDVNRYGEIELVAKTVKRQRDFTGREKRLRVKTESCDEAYVVGVQRVVRRGNLEGGKPVVEYQPNLRYGRFATRVEAKAAWARENDPDLANASDAFAAKHFDQNARNLKHVKILREDELDEAARLNVATTPLDQARTYAEDAFSKAGKSLDDVIPDFDRNYQALQAKTKKALDMPRNQMPVIEPGDMATFTKRLQTGKLDLFRPWARGKLDTPTRFKSKADGEAWVELGYEDGDKTDDRLQAKLGKKAANTLLPTQSQIWLNKLVENIIRFGVPSSSSPIAKATIIVSREGFILDGHHRFGQAMLAAPTLKLSTLAVPLDIKLLLRVGRAYGEAIGNRVKEDDEPVDEFFGLPTKLMPVKGAVSRMVRHTRRVSLSWIRKHVRDDPIVRFMPSDKELAQVLGALGFAQQGNEFVFEGEVDEGIHDPYILKAVFMTGGAGSGKSFIAQNMFGGMGLKVVNSDDLLERYMKAAKLDLGKDVGSAAVQKPGGLRDRAKAVTTKRLDAYIAGRLGLIIDSTAAKVDKVKGQVKRLRELGYDCSMVFVNTSLETALARNEARPRTVPVAVATQDWNKVQANLALYRTLFGPANFREIENNSVLPARKVVSELIPELTRRAYGLLNRPVQNSKGKAWMDQQLKAVARDTYPTERPALAASYVDNAPALMEAGDLIRLLDARTKAAEWEGSLRDFLRDNADDEDTVRQVKRLRPGQSIRLGGGAAPEWIVQRSKGGVFEDALQEGYAAFEPTSPMAGTVPKRSFPKFLSTGVFMDSATARKAGSIVRRVAVTGVERLKDWRRLSDAETIRIWGSLGLTTHGPFIGTTSNLPGATVRLGEGMDEEEELDLVEEECLLIDDWTDAIAEAVETAPPTLVVEWADQLRAFDRYVGEGDFERAETIAEAICEALQLDEYRRTTMGSRMKKLRSRRTGMTKAVKAGKASRTEIRRANRKRRLAMRRSPSERLKQKRYRRRTRHHRARVRSLPTARESVVDPGMDLLFEDGVLVGMRPTLDEAGSPDLGVHPDYDTAIKAARRVVKRLGRHAAVGIEKRREFGRQVFTVKLVPKNPAKRQGHELRMEIVEAVDEAKKLTWKKGKNRTGSRDVYVCREFPELSIEKWEFDLPVRSSDYRIRYRGEIVAKNIDRLADAKDEAREMLDEGLDEASNPFSPRSPHRTLARERPPVAGTFGHLYRGDRFRLPNDPSGAVLEKTGPTTYRVVSAKDAAARGLKGMQLKKDAEVLRESIDEAAGDRTFWFYSPDGKTLITSGRGATEKQAVASAIRGLRVTQPGPEGTQKQNTLRAGRYEVRMHESADAAHDSVHLVIGWNGSSYTLEFPQNLGPEGSGQENYLEFDTYEEAVGYASDFAPQHLTHAIVSNLSPADQLRFSQPGSMPHESLGEAIPASQEFGVVDTATDRIVFKGSKAASMKELAKRRGPKPKHGWEHRGGGFALIQSRSKQVGDLWSSQASRESVDEYYGRRRRSYGGDPRWIKAKRPGTDMHGRAFKKGDDVLYFPNGRHIISDPVKAEQEWRSFLSAKGDEEGMPYADSVEDPGGPALDEAKLRLSKKDPAKMSAGDINREIEKLDAAQSENMSAMIEAGRGNERFSEIARATDPLAQQIVAIEDRLRALRDEGKARYGPSLRGKLPTGTRAFGRRTR